MILRTALVLCAFLNAVQVGPLLAQDNPVLTPPTIKSDVREVLIPVVITDKAGHYMAYLDRDDFIVSEDGVPQKIINFRRSTLRTTSEGITSSATKTPAPVSPVTPHAEQNPKRTYLICLDTLHSTFSDFTQMRNALKQFFAQEQSDDSQYALMVLGRNLHVVVDSTRDPQVILTTLQSKSLLKTIRDSDAANVAFEVDRFARLVQHWCEGCQCTNISQDMVALDGVHSCAGLKQQVTSASLSFPSRAYVTNRGFLEQLRQLVTAMTTMPTRRTVLLMSDGFNRYAGQEFYDILTAFHVADPNLKFNPRDLQPELESILRLAVQYDVRFYTIDSRGLYTHAAVPGNGFEASSPGVSNETTQAVMSTAWFNGDAMSQLARQTGGQFFENSNDLLRGVRTAFAAGREEYILAYVPSNPNMDGRFRKISVAVKGKQFKIATKAGYWATP
jgi:VWFA-related protein